LTSPSRFRAARRRNLARLRGVAKVFAVTAWPVASVMILTVLTFSRGARAVDLGACRSTRSILPRGLGTPSWEHPFGTDDLGQDLLARMLYGGRISLAVGFRGDGGGPSSPAPSSARYRASPEAASMPY